MKSSDGSEAYNYSVYFLGANGVDEEEFKASAWCVIWQRSPTGTTTAIWATW